jgi:hypothetical protein
VATKTFDGGTALKQALDRIAKNVTKKAQVSIGWFEDAKYPANQGGQPVAMVAAIQEFGAPRAGIPPRPFVRTLIAKESGNWGPVLAQQLKHNKYDARIALTALGIVIAEQLQQSIIDVNSPPLSKITLMLRKMKSKDQSLVVTGKTVGEAARRVAAGESVDGVNTKPLDDTGHMIRSIGHVVE